MSETNNGRQPDLATMTAMGLVVEGGGFGGVNSISVCSPNAGCKDMRVQPVTIVEDPMGARREYTIFKPSHRDLVGLKAEMGF